MNNLLSYLPTLIQLRHLVHVRKLGVEQLISRALAFVSLIATLHREGESLATRDYTPAPTF